MDWPYMENANEKNTKKLWNSRTVGSRKQGRPKNTFKKEINYIGKRDWRRKSGI